MKGPIDAGGFVYPVYIDEDHPSRRVADYGITRRDWLAGLAMQGMVAGMNVDKSSMHPVTALEVARQAYHVADLMIRLSREEAAAEQLTQTPVAVPAL
jgi:hypothetical protein